MRSDNRLRRVFSRRIGLVAMTFHLPPATDRQLLNGMTSPSSRSLRISFGISLMAPTLKAAICSPDELNRWTSRAPKPRAESIAKQAHGRKGCSALIPECPVRRPSAAGLEVFFLPCNRLLHGGFSRIEGEKFPPGPKAAIGPQNDLDSCNGFSSRIGLNWREIEHE